MLPAALIFDFDGLILDTETPEFQSWVRVFEQHGCVMERAVWTRCIGHGWHHFDPFAHLQSQLGRDVDRDAISADRRAWNLAAIEAQPILPGVERLLDTAAAAGVKLGIASSSPHRWVDGHLKRLGLFDRFEVIACADDTGVAKPDPAVYLLACRSLGVEPGRCVALEDSFNGVTAAVAAGLITVAVPNPMTHDMDLSAAHHRMASLEAVDLALLLPGLLSN